LRLSGQYPSKELDTEFELASPDLPHELPLSLPAMLVEQRPDVRAAEELVHAANAEVGVAIANRLPHITLSANLGAVTTAIAGRSGEPTRNRSSKGERCSTAASRRGEP